MPIRDAKERAGRCTHCRKNGFAHGGIPPWAFPAFDGNMSCITKGGTPIGYINAEEVLPKELLAQIRNYIEGEAIYIPKACEKRKTWGGKTGTRAEYDRRNRAIVDEYRGGQSVTYLAEKYCLCPDSIRKIIRNAEI